MSGPYPLVPPIGELNRLVNEIGGAAAANFDAARVREFSTGVANGTMSLAGNVVRGSVTAPLACDITDLPVPGKESHARASTAGRAAIRSGAVAMVILGGGMATRFGGVVKASVEVIDGYSFLELKLYQAMAAGPSVPVAVMTSWMTDNVILSHVAARGLPMPSLFRQDVSLRLRPDGGLFRNADGAVSLYSTGHGDLPTAILRSGVLDALRARGVRTLVVSNMDNLFATLDPVVIGVHLLSGRRLTVEVTDCAAGARGALVARLDGRPCLLDSTELPADGRLTGPVVLNTNTFLIDLDALYRVPSPGWLYARKEVDGRAAVQIERPLHHLTRALATGFLRVPAAGPECRFLPVKTLSDMDRAAPVLRRSLVRLLTDPGSRAARS